MRDGREDVGAPHLRDGAADALFEPAGIHQHVEREERDHGQADEHGGRAEHGLSGRNEAAELEAGLDGLDRDEDLGGELVDRIWQVQAVEGRLGVGDEAGQRLEVDDDLFDERLQDDGRSSRRPPPPG